MNLKDALRAAWPECRDPAVWVPHWQSALADPRATAMTADDVIMLIAQCGHESAGGTRLEESLNYTSAARIAAVWPRRFKPAGPLNPAEYVRSPAQLAEAVYGGRMGNGPVGTGDGWTYRGRGLIQTTGRDQYAALAAWTGDPLLLAEPERLTRPDVAAVAAVAYWTMRGLRAADGIERVTRRINGGTVGLDDRRRRFNRARAA